MKFADANGPLVPVGNLKLSINFDYNKGKWGLDMCTKNYWKVAFDAVSLLLEGKDALRLFDGVVANCWNSEQGRLLIKPFVERYKLNNEGILPLNISVRSKAKSLSLQNHTFSVAIQWLSSLERERVSLVYSQDICRFFVA